MAHVTQVGPASDRWAILPLGQPMSSDAAAIQLPLARDFVTGRQGASPIDVGAFHLGQDLVLGAPPAGDFSGGLGLRTVVGDFQRFVSALEGAEGDWLRPGAAGEIRRLLAPLLAVTFAESLFVHYGVDPLRRSVDLLAGMRLRLETTTAQQLLDSGIAPLDPVNYPVGMSYLPGAPTWSDIIATVDGRTRVGLFPDRSLLPAAGSAALSSSLVDLDAGPLDHPHLRLCYPAKLFAADLPAPRGPDHLPVIVAASTLILLDAASDALAQGRTPPATVVVAPLTGRTLPVVEIPVTLSDGDQAEREHVPLGTTLRQAVERVAPFPRLAFLPGAVTLERLLPLRGRKWRTNPTLDQDGQFQAGAAKGRITSPADLLADLRAWLPDLDSLDELDGAQWKAIAESLATHNASRVDPSDRQLRDAVVGPWISAPAAIARYQLVSVDAGVAGADGADGYDVPLLAGDRVTVKTA